MRSGAGIVIVELSITTVDGFTADPGGGVVDDFAQASKAQPPITGMRLRVT
jgi:hypothetical protein